tara:strand:- start:85 stop:573 length:489 start_codon:yes stop_codon:yes gene_type:complete
MSLSISAQIEAGVLKALQIAIGRVAFADSQQRVPVVTGKLKASGRYSDTSDGFTIEYTAPYAKNVHDGVKFQTSTEVHTSLIKEHERKTANGSTRVRAHKKNYVGMKPVITRGGWKVLPMERARRANPFLMDAIEDRIAQLFTQNGALEQYLPRSIEVDSIE